MTKRKTYTKEFKLEAVHLAKERGFSQSARDLGINANLIHRWKNDLEQDGEKAFPGHGNPKDEHLAQLERENRRLQEENAILKKAVGIFTHRPH